MIPPTCSTLFIKSGSIVMNVMIHTYLSINNKSIKNPYTQRRKSCFHICTYQFAYTYTQLNNYFTLQQAICNIFDLWHDYIFPPVISCPGARQMRRNAVIWLSENLHTRVLWQFLVFIVFANINWQRFWNFWVFLPVGSEISSYPIRR